MANELSINDPDPKTLVKICMNLSSAGQGSTSEGNVAGLVLPWVLEQCISNKGSDRPTVEDGDNSK